MFQSEFICSKFAAKCGGVMRQFCFKLKKKERIDSGVFIVNFKRTTLIL